METRIGLIGIIVEDLNATEKLNQIFMIMALISSAEWVCLIVRKN